MKDGGPAFPDGRLTSHRGMTLRDYFAAAALTGLLANSHDNRINKPLSLASALEMAELAYHNADEMLKHRERTAASDRTSSTKENP